MFSSFQWRQKLFFSGVHAHTTCTCTCTCTASLLTYFFLPLLVRNPPLPTLALLLSDGWSSESKKHHERPTEASQQGRDHRRQIPPDDTIMRSSARERGRRGTTTRRRRHRGRGCGRTRSAGRLLWRSGHVMSPRHTVLAR